jgi:hypothetical protein
MLVRVSLHGIDRDCVGFVLILRCQLDANSAEPSPWFACQPISVYYYFYFTKRYNKLSFVTLNQIVQWLERLLLYA